jgi:catalase
VEVGVGAVALVLSESGAERLTGEAAARDFVADAFAHCKFIAFTSGAAALLLKAGVDPDADEGMIGLDDPKGTARFIESCRKLRLWSREVAVKL